MTCIKSIEYFLIQNIILINCLDYNISNIKLRQEV